ncbi:helix-turn-helix transcriptional regulator [Comamonas sp. NoAH]|uniref:helix-turn-helix transcriptional regulator n=1 Tax=Comamonas halotolerans TaxID=3041496 RepID=UPI0024E0E0D6|nr:AlpA family phage regulatory protein [Comamonas sp. NoAH]
MNTPTPPISIHCDEQLLRIGAVSQKIGMARSTIYKRIHKNQFPRPLVISKKLVAWKKSDIENWIKSLDHHDKEGTRRV